MAVAVLAELGRNLSESSRSVGPAALSNSTSAALANSSPIWLTLYSAATTGSVEEISQVRILTHAMSRSAATRWQTSTMDSRDRKSTRLNSSHANISYA